MIEQLFAAGGGRYGPPNARAPAGGRGRDLRLKPGIPWRYLPAEFGAWQTVHRRHSRWSRDGTWARVLAHRGEVLLGAVLAHRARWHDNNPRLRPDEPDDHAIGRSRGGLTIKTHALFDGRGRALVLIVSPGAGR